MAVPIIGALTASRTKQLNRSSYALRNVSVILLCAGLNLLFSYFLTTIIAGFYSLVLYFAAVFLHARWSVHRLRDAGRDTRWAFLIVVPLVNLVAMIVWCFVPTREDLGQPAAVPQ